MNAASGVLEPALFNNRRVVYSNPIVGRQFGVAIVPP